jgi:hypothetical protein
MNLKNRRHEAESVIDFSPTATVGSLLAQGVIRLLTSHQQLDNLQKPRGSTDVPINEESTDD